MEENEIIDYLVLGGGCSALSLINKIIKKKIRKYSFVIIEKRKKYYDDKSWCFWTQKNHEFKRIIEKNWNSFSFSNEGKSNYLKSKLFKYSYIRSIKFYNLVISQISTQPFIKLKLNENVQIIRYINDHYEVKTDKNIYRAKNVLDTRPNLKIFKKKPFMYQSFFGYEVKFEKKINLNINNAYLMHNMHADKKNFYFEYILPINNTTFLFEFTVFSNKDFPLYKIKSKLNNILKSYKKYKFKIIRKEYGKIPLGFPETSNYSKEKNYFIAGTLAGAIRPSSGYGFLNIQDWAEKSANNLKDKGTLINNYGKKNIAYFLDKLLLRIISSNSIYTPHIFFNFSKNILADPFIKFMIGNASLRDYFKVINSMPKKIFLKCIIKK